jgi:hypothetical protein
MKSRLYYYFHGWLIHWIPLFINPFIWWMSQFILGSMKSPPPMGIQWKAVLMKSRFDEKPLWWKVALMKSHFDEKLLRWKATPHYKHLKDYLQASFTLTSAYKLLTNVLCSYIFLQTSHDLLTNFLCI